MGKKKLNELYICKSKTIRDKLTKYKNELFKCYCDTLILYKKVYEEFFNVTNILKKKNISNIFLKEKVMCNNILSFINTKSNLLLLRRSILNKKFKFNVFYLKSFLIKKK